MISLSMINQARNSVEKIRQFPVMQTARLADGLMEIKNLCNIVDAICDSWEETENGMKPANMDAENGPVCGCGKPSRYESGWCGSCVAQVPPTFSSSFGGAFISKAIQENRKVIDAVTQSILVKTSFKESCDVVGLNEALKTLCNHELCLLKGISQVTQIEE